MICILVRGEVFLEHVFDMTMAKSLSDMTARSVVFACFFCFWLCSEKFRSTYIFLFSFLMSWMV